MIKHSNYKSAVASVKKRSSGSFLDFLFVRNKRTIRRDFINKSYKNPYYIKNRLPTRTKAPRLKIGIITASFITIAGIIMFHSYFDINNITINGLQRISHKDIESIVNQKLDQKRWHYFNNRNEFIADVSGIKSAVNEKYSLDSLKITKKYPKAIQIDIKEKLPKLIMQSADTNYLVDEEGKIIQEISANDLQTFAALNIPRFQQSTTSSAFKLNDSVITPTAEQFIAYLFQNVPKKAEISLNYAILADLEGRTVNLVTIEGWKVIVDRQSDWDKQIQVLAIILRDRIKNNRSNLHYIDVRYENRSYFQ